MSETGLIRRMASALALPADLDALGADGFVVVAVSGTKDLIDVILGPHRLISGPCPQSWPDTAPNAPIRPSGSGNSSPERGRTLLAAAVSGNARVAEMGLLGRRDAGRRGRGDASRPGGRAARGAPAADRTGGTVKEISTR